METKVIDIEKDSTNQNEQGSRREENMKGE